MRIAATLSLLALAVLTPALSANAATPTPITQQNVSLALADGLTQQTLDACHAQNRTAVVAVVDRGGNLVALRRDDNVGPHNTLAAQRKAYTALSSKTPTLGSREIDLSRSLLQISPLSRSREWSIIRSGQIFSAQEIRRRPTRVC